MPLIEFEFALLGNWPLCVRVVWPVNIKLFCGIMACVSVLVGYYSLMYPETYGTFQGIQVMSQETTLTSCISEAFDGNSQKIACG